MNSIQPDKTILIGGIGELIDRFDTVLLDQWGVIHDGVTLHAGAEDAIRRLKAAGKHIVVLSNSGKRVDDSHGRMRKMGIEPSTFDGVITSGELVYENLMQRADPFYANLGKKFLMLAWDDNRGIVEDTGFQEIDDIEEADFIFCTGTDRQDLTEYDPVLERGLARGLPMICANPDQLSLQPDGTLKICPGALADAYEAMGGVVKSHGKPMPEIYAAAKRLLAAAGIDIGRAIGVGDSLKHDIRGAADSGHESLFICGGIHRDEIGPDVSEAAIATVCEDYGIVPPHAAPFFVWS